MSFNTAGISDDDDCTSVHWFDICQQNDWLSTVCRQLNPWTWSVVIYSRQPDRHRLRRVGHADDHHRYHAVFDYIIGWRYSPVVGLHRTQLHRQPISIWHDDQLPAELGLDIQPISIHIWHIPVHNVSDAMLCSNLVNTVDPSAFTVLGL